MAKQSDNKAAAHAQPTGAAFGQACRFYMTISNGESRFAACRCPARVDEGKAWWRNPDCTGCQHGEAYPEITTEHYIDRSEEKRLREDS